MRSGESPARWPTLPSRQSSFTFKLKPKHKYKYEYKYRARLPPQVYPEVSSITGHLQRVSAKVRDQETREDLKTQANMYNVMLTAQIEQRKCDSSQPGKPDRVCVVRSAQIQRRMCGSSRLWILSGFSR